MLDKIENDWAFVHRTVVRTDYEAKERARKTLAQQVADYLAQGGIITHCTSADNYGAKEVNPNREDALAERKRLDNVNVRVNEAKKQYYKEKE